MVSRPDKALPKVQPAILRELSLLAMQNGFELCAFDHGVRAKHEGTTPHILMALHSIFAEKNRLRLATPPKS